MTSAEREAAACAAEGRGEYGKASAIRRGGAAAEGVDLEAIEAREPRIRERAKDLQENNRGWLGEYYWLIDVPPLIAAHRSALARIAGLEAENATLKHHADVVRVAREEADARADAAEQERDAAIERFQATDDDRCRILQELRVASQDANEAQAERDAARAEARGLREQMAEARGHLGCASEGLGDVMEPTGQAAYAALEEVRKRATAVGGHVALALAALSREPAPHIDVREAIRATHEQIREALEEEAKAWDAIEEPEKIDFASALRAFAAKLGKDGPR